MASVLITGSGSGIGLATALRFARAGDAAYGTVHHDDGALGEAAAQAGVDLTVFELDVTDDASVDAGVRRVLDETGRLDVLVNNAARVLIAPVEETSDAEAKSVFDANFFGALRVIRAVLPTMRERRSGTIVNVSSIGAVVPTPFYGVYAASKMALEAASDSLYHELQPFGIRVLVMQPGNFRTRILRHAMRARTFDEDSPYWAGREQMKEDTRRILAELVGEDRTDDPAYAGDFIFEAVRSQEHRMRYPVGRDAERVASMMAGMSRQEFSDQVFSPEEHAGA
jgi:NAD(P)-dependent dehydrogenase (short-subunit alcohol dehydrogenase family)